jgi:hypothetical protein
MAAARQKHWHAFLQEPPDLEGDIRLEVQPIEDGRAILRFKHPDSPGLELHARWLAVPYPSGLRRLAAADPDLEAVVVERIPRGLDAAAKELRISYLDRWGRGRIVGPGFVYVVQSFPTRPPADLGAGDLPDPPASPGVGGAVSPGRSKGRVSPFAPKASRLARAFLAEPERRWRLSEIAGEVDVDPGNAHRVLGALVDDGLVERDDDHYVLPDPGSLLEAWAERGRAGRRDRVRIAAVGELHDFLYHVVDELGGDVVVSGEFAAELLAPHLVARRALVHCFSEGAWAEVAGSEWAAPLRPSGHIEVQRSDEGVGQFGSVHEDIPIASPAQIYVDLAREHSRAREAADHLRREVLGY